MAMKNIRILSAITFMLLDVAAHAEAVKGVVVYNKSGCRSRYVVNTSLGFAILEWYGGNDPTEGDEIVGEINSYGFKDLYNITQESSMRVYVEDYMLSNTTLKYKFFEKFCG